MEKGWWGRLGVFLFFTILAIIYIYPSVANLDLEKTKFPYKHKITLGLDLQGGLYMVLGVEVDKIFEEMIKRQARSLKEQLTKDGLKDAKVQIFFPAHEGVSISDKTQESEIQYRAGLPQDDPRIQIQFPSDKREQVYHIVRGENSVFRLTEEKAGEFEVGLSHKQRGDIREKTIDQSIEVIRNRIDQFGVTEPTIVSQGSDRIVVELPGVREIERAKALIGRTARLEFKIVKEGDGALPNLPQLVSKIEKENNLEFKKGDKLADYVEKLNQYAKSELPKGTMIAFGRPSDAKQEKAEIDPHQLMLYLLTADADVTGDDLQDAQVQVNPEDNNPEVAFQLTPAGAIRFEKLTGENIRKRLAIVLDNVVYSAPNIQSKISSSGRITLGSAGSYQDTIKEAKDLAIVLRAGALPAQLTFLEQRVVGAKLGEDSIAKGIKASVIGVLAVFLFSLFYYQVSGTIVILTLILNIIYVVAILVGMEATLTLPGIAGIALTIGFAVDSNIIIYERIREELRAGKTIHGAMEAGFQKAIRTILDANITNAAGALVLLIFGTGPIKGFAVTLIIGIVTTLFTAVFVSRLMFQFYISVQESRGKSEISI